MTQATATRIEQYLAAKQKAHRSDVLIRAGAALGSVVLLIAAGLLMGPINAIRKDAQLTLSEDTVRGLPPDIALMTKTGTLRGLAIDVAFIRLEELKQQQRYFELMQLSDWLCKLAPRYASVWSYSAWNMAYNISVTQYTPEARWMWVKNGIENLRNRGLRYNPNSITLYKELAYIFWHKIGDKLDDYHWQYKMELAVEIQGILGPPPMGVSHEETVDAFRPIAEAPPLEPLLESNEVVSALAEDIRTAGMTLDGRLLRFVAQHAAREMEQSQLLDKEAEQSDESADAGQGKPRGSVDESRLMKLLNKPDHQQAMGKLIAAVRADHLRSKLNMDPEFMLELMEDYGPIDWRNPFAHSLYWGTYGDIYTKSSLNLNPNDSMNAVRFIFFSLENMARAGRMILEPNWEQPNESFIQMLPDLRFIKHMHAAYLKYGEEQFGDDPRFIPNTAGPNYLSGHRNFLMTSIRQLYLEGGEENIEEAKSYYYYLRQTHRNEDGSVKAQYDMPFDRFVLNNIWESLDTQANAQAFVASFLRRSLHDLAEGKVADSVKHFNQARKGWNYYMRDVGTDRNTRRALEPIGIIRRDVVRDIMRAPPNAISLLQKHRVWSGLDLATRQAVYDDVLPIVEKYCTEHEPPYAIDKVLPQPPGMEEYRQDPDETLEELERLDETVSQGQRQSPE